MLVMGVCTGWQRFMGVEWMREGPWCGRVGGSHILRYKVVEKRW